MHKTFRHIITKDMAMNMAIRDIMDNRLLSTRFGSVNGSHLHRVWTRAAQCVNSFLRANESLVAWNCERVKVEFSDLMDAPLICILSEMEDPTGGNDYLFLIINELISRYNKFVQNICAIVSSDNDEEVHPRTLVRLSKSSVAVVGAVSSTQVVMDELAESYWNKDDQSFDLERATRAICYDMKMMGLIPIKNPLSFLREKFAFQEDKVANISNEDSNKTCFRSSDGLFFARYEDISLYEQVREDAEKSGFPKGSNNIAHTMMVIFHSFSYTEWLGLLEGLRNAMGYLGTEFVHANDAFGNVVSDMQRFGFPHLDTSQANFLRSITSNDIIEVISVCGEQLASEAYRYVGIPSHLAEPLSSVAKSSIRNAIRSLSTSKCSHVVVGKIDDFSEDVLGFYCDQLIIPSSVTSNEGLAAFLKNNNCCDESDIVFSLIPSCVTIRNYVDVQKVLHQAKLELLSNATKRTLGNDATNGHLSVRADKKGEWSWTTSSRRPEEGYSYHWKPIQDEEQLLWFLPALSVPHTTVKESRESGLCIDTETKEEVDSSLLVNDDSENGDSSENMTQPMPSTKDFTSDHASAVDSDMPTSHHTDCQETDDAEFNKDATDETILSHFDVNSTTDCIPPAQYSLVAAGVVVVLSMVAAICKYYVSYGIQLDEVDLEDDLEEVIRPMVYECDAGLSDNSFTDDME